MTILASLVRAYDRLPDAPPFGYSAEKIGFVIALNADGTVAHVIDWREGEGKKARPRMMLVPQPVKRTAGIAPNFLWDKTSYVLGITAGEGKRTADEHAAFIARQIGAIGETDDEGLNALRLFLQGWRSEMFEPPMWPDDMKDQNVVFALESERRSGTFLHLRPAAKAVWARVSAPASAEKQICLVTGQDAAIARLHPSIKGVWGAQSSGAALVSFNLDAFTSYGHDQGDNAPVSEAAAFAYTTALNRFLERDSGHRVQIGDASTVFWADASDMEAAADAEIWGSIILDENDRKREEENYVSKDIKIKLQRVVKGASLAEVEPKLAKGVTFYVLGLSPNAARISVRFFWQGSFSDLASNYRDYMRDIAFEPWPRDKPHPTIRQCTTRLGIARIDRSGKVSFDHDQVPNQFAGELLRSIVTGDRFPRALLGTLLMRVRNDHLLDPTRVAMIKAVLVRDLRLRGRLPKLPDGTENKEYLMQPVPDDPNSARRLGRLFAIMERIQSASLGEDVNATIKDKFLSAAASTPERVFARLMDLSEKHITRLRRGHSDAAWIARLAQENGLGTSEMARRVGNSLGAQMGRLATTFSETGFPTQHDNAEQGFFMIGYYQERYSRKPGSEGGHDLIPDDIDPNENGED